MIILGLGFLSDASACILRDGELLAAVSEERLNRIKLWHGVPHASIECVLAQTGLSLQDVDLVATHGATDGAFAEIPFDDKAKLISDSSLSAERKTFQLKALQSRRDHERMVVSVRTPDYLAEVAKLGRPVRVYSHHQAHAACAFYGSGWEDALVLTADGWGEDASSTLWLGHGSELTRLSYSHTFDSLGYFYGGITKALGFIPHRHEGKVLGLAAFCADPKSYSAIADMVDVLPEEGRFLGRMENGLYLPRYDNPALAEFVMDFSREDVAAAAQRRLEEVVCALVAKQGDRARRLALAGGIFANVKLNQRLAELDNVEEVYVFPNMGDGGLSVGSAWLAHAEIYGVAPRPATSMYLGPSIDNREALACLEQSGFPFTRPANIAETVGNLLADGHVVIRCTGAMEFGPRALGHRSILYRASDASVNDWLNRRLHRSEFMPFAPATLASDAPSCYRNLDAGRSPARFMAMTFDCTQKMREQAPAAVHVDGTARPQLVSEADYPDFFAILTAYHAKTGLSSLVNTSFNMHEEPIVCSAQDALRAFSASGLPFMALGDFLVEGPDVA
ncbi:MAG: carbamoyl transferase [Alphaproteobacteria bacterium]|nr:carbamoyl transferase [Alphaproteobacteria bacterium]